MYDDDALIDLVQKYRFLYDKTHKWHKNKVEKEKGWTKIGDMLNMTSEECEQRWNILRNRFCTEMRKEKNSPTGSALRPWPLYEDLRWLKPHVIPRNPRRKIMHNDVRLIDLVHENSILYDKTHILYKSEDEREKAWITIADTLKISPEVCEQRWGLLRNRFCTELRKENSIPEGSTPNPSQLWPLYECLFWLKPHVIPRRSRGSYPAPRLPSDWDLSEQDAAVACMEVANCETIYSQSRECSPDEIVQEESMEQASCSKSAVERENCTAGTAGDTRFMKTCKKDDNAVLGEAFTGALSQFTEIIKQEEKHWMEHRNDPDDLFGIMVGQYLKEVKDIKKKISIKSAILRIFENIL